MICSRVKPLKAKLSKTEPVPRLVCHYDITLPQDYFDFEKSLRLFRKQIPKKALGGLINIGYNCYMNSVLQCLFYTPGFPEFCTTLPNVMYQVNSDLPFMLANFGNLYKELLENKSACPVFFLHDSWTVSEIFRKPIQQDAHEYLIKLLIKFEAECRAAMDFDGPTVISHFFKGSSLNQITFNGCGHSVEQKLPFYDLQIPVRGFTSAEDAIKALFDPQQIETEICPICQAESSAVKHIHVKHYPLILTVTMMRFDNYLRKIEDFLEFPDILIFEDGKIIYQLYAMIIHEGRHISHGHFIAIVRDGKLNWHKADDVVMYTMKDEVVMKSCPYVLLYRQTKL